MKRSLLRGFALAALVIAGSAQAADLPVSPTPAPAYVVPTSPRPSWTGFYVGIDGGYTWNRMTVAVPAAPAGGIASANPDTGTVGGHFGFLYEFNPLVLGVEGDAMWLDGSANGPFSGNPTQGIIASNKWDASVRGIAGVAFDQWLVYGTGGASWIDGNQCGVLVFPTAMVCAPSSSVSFTRTGWVAGAGLAYAFTQNLIGRVEYLHADYGNFSANVAAATGGVVNLTDKTDTVRAGLSWKFGLQ